MLKEKKATKDYINILKVVACFLVIVNHTNSEIFLGGATGRLAWLISIFTFFMAKMAVPIFMMVSGALMLSKDYNYKKIFIKVIKYIIILLLVSVIFNYVINGNRDNIVNFLIKFHNNQIFYPLWYIYFYIALLLTIPILQKMVKNMNNIDFLVYFIIAFGICGTIYPLLAILFPSLSTSNYFNFFWPYLGFVLIGYYIEEKMNLEKLKNIHITLLIISVFVFPLINSLTAYYLMRNNFDYLVLDNFSLFTIAIPAISLFILFKKYCSKIKLKKLNNVIGAIAKTTIIIYLIHGMFINPLFPIFETLNNYLPINLAMYIYEFILFGLCFIISFIILRIPYFNKLFT